MHRFPLSALALALLTAGNAFAQAASAPAAAASATDDPYIWLEKVDDPKAMDWVRAENGKTLKALEADPRFPEYNKQALALAQTHDRIPFAAQIDGGLWNFWQDADHVRGIWRVTSAKDYDKGGTPTWRTVLDLDKVAKDEKANWVWEGANCESHREYRCLLPLSDGGEDATTVREFDLRKGAFVKGGFVLPKGKQNYTWNGPDEIVAAREWAPGELTSSGYAYIVKRVKRGQPLSAAVEIYRGKPTDVAVELNTLTDAQGHQAVIVQRGITFFESEVNLLTPAGVKKLNLPPKVGVEALYDGQLIVKLDQDWTAGGKSFGQGTLVAIDLAAAIAKPDDLQPTVIVAPTPRQSVQQVTNTRTGLLVTSLDNVRGRVNVYTRAKDGTWSATPIALPDNTDVHIAGASDHSSTAYLSVAGFLQPQSQWRLDGAQARLLRSLPAQFDASRDEVEQYEATSTDGTKIPYFIVHPKGMKMDGSNPAILYAYGGFANSEAPYYSGSLGKLWLEHGGVWVLANIRGGGEFGPAWHEAGLKTKRQIIYDDFASVARDLATRGVSDAKHLGIMGGSNGGLLMGVEMTQHPELWNAVDIQVPLLDMLRYEQIAAGASWVGEYGSVSVPEERAFLARISPYHNLRRDAKYPKALVWTTTKDDRVGPQHARKYAARLSEYGIPYYYYEVIEGGHGSGANQKERAHTTALEYVYFSEQLMGR